MSPFVLCELADASPMGIESFSPFCVKIHRALRLAGLPYTRRHGATPASHKALNPVGQVPVLLADGRPLADSTAILRWLVAEGHLHATPEAWLWEELADTSLNGFLVAARWADPENWPRTKAAYFVRMPALLRLVIPPLLRRGVVKALVARDVLRAGPAVCWERFEALLDALDARAPAAGTGWVGPWSVADVAIFGQLRSLCTPLTPRQAARVRARPRLAAWLDGVEAATGAVRAAA